MLAKKTYTLRSEGLIISESLTQDFCSTSRRRNRRIASYATVSTTQKTDKKTSQDSDIIKSSLLSMILPNGKIMSKHKLLIVEDEIAILQGLIDVFIFHGFEVDSAEDGKTGLAKALSTHYSLILLDVMLPLMDGFTICNKIREQDKNQPIIMLTAKSSEADIINGLTLGADDYIAKPFSIRELVLRVNTVLKRSYLQTSQTPILQIGPMQIDTANLVQLNSENPCSFSRRELEILHFLQTHCERPVSREELLEHVWGYKQADTIETRTVDIHIAKLRRKVEVNPKQPQWLVTIRGEGYRLNQ